MIQGWWRASFSGWWRSWNSVQCYLDWRLNSVVLLGWWWRSSTELQVWVSTVKKIGFGHCCFGRWRRLKHMQESKHYWRVKGEVEDEPICWRCRKLQPSAEWRLICYIEYGDRNRIGHGVGQVFYTLGRVS